MRKQGSWIGLTALMMAGVYALAACSPAKEAEPKAQQSADALPPAGQFDKTDVSTQSWVTAFASLSANGAAPVRVCHVGPAINEDVSLAVVVEQNGARQVGVARVPTVGVSKPLGDVELQVDKGAAHVIHAGPMNASALVVWPPGTATLATGAEADAILSELEKGTTVQVKESAGSATRSFPTEGLSQAISNCSKP